MDKKVVENKIRRSVKQEHDRNQKRLDKKTTSFISLRIQYNLSIRNQKTNEEFQISDIEDYMDESPVALIGGPGAGKSTLLLKMAVQLSEKNLDNCAAMIPIYVQCGLLSSYDRLEDEIHLSGYSEEEKKYLWENGKLCLLFDGINEAVNVEMGKLLRDVVNLSEEYPECRYVINCRAIEFPIWASSYFEPYSILPVKDEQIRTQFCKEFGDVTGEKYYTELINSSHNYLFELCKNPLLLSLVIRIISQSMDSIEEFSFSQIKGKGDIYREFCRSLIQHELKKIKRERESYFEIIRDRLFTTLAYYMQANNKVYISREEMEVVIRNMPYGKGRETDYIKFISSSSSGEKSLWYREIAEDVIKSSFFNLHLLETKESVYISFIHQSFQEFYAGKYMADNNTVHDKKYVEYLLTMHNRRNWDSIEFSCSLDSTNTIIKYVMIYAIINEDTDALILFAKCIDGNESLKNNCAIVEDCCIWLLDAFKYWNVAYKYELIYAAEKLLSYVGTDFPERLIEDVKYFSDKYAGEYLLTEYPESMDFSQLKQVIIEGNDSAKMNAIYTLGKRKWARQDVEVVRDYLFTLIAECIADQKEQAVKALKNLIENNTSLNINDNMYQTLINIVKNKNETARTRTYTLNILAEIGKPNAINVLMDYLKDKTNPYRDSASWSLQELVLHVKKNESSQEYIRDFYYTCLINESDDQTGMYSKGNLVYTLSKLESGRLINPIKEWLSTQKEAYVQEDGINAIGCLGGINEVDYLIPFTRSEDPVIRAKAYKGLVDIGYELSESELERIKNDRYSIVNIIIMKYIERNESDENKLELKELMNLSEDNNKSEIFSQNYENVNNVVNYNC